MKYFKRICSEIIKLNMCRNQVWHTCFIPCIKTWKTKTTKLRKKRSTQLLRVCWSFLTKLMTCQNLQNKLLNITVLFIWYLLASKKKMSLAKHGELYFILASVWKKWFPTLSWLSSLGPLFLLLPKILKLFGFAVLLFQKCVMHTKLDIYVFVPQF